MIKKREYSGIFSVKFWCNSQKVIPDHISVLG